MKLIDRDKFISDMFDLYIEQKWKPSDIHFSLLDVRSNIDFKGYEVKAIPIEFIEEQIAKTTDINNRDELDVLYAGNLGYLLKLWEKENGEEERTNS